MSNEATVTIVNTTGGWAVCQTNADGNKLYVMADIIEPRFTKEHAELVAENLKHHLEKGGHSYAKPLPLGVSVVD